MEMLPLGDLRVIDVTIARAGPTCVRQLADWGTDVIRIDPITDSESRRRAEDRRTSRTSIATSDQSRSI